MDFKFRGSAVLASEGSGCSEGAILSSWVDCENLFLWLHIPLDMSLHFFAGALVCSALGGMDRTPIKELGGQLFVQLHFYVLGSADHL